MYETMRVIGEVAMPNSSNSTAEREEIMPDPQLEKRQRRPFSAELKRRILDEVDACTERGRVAAILRREGLYASQLSTWRRQREERGLAGLEPKTPGRKPVYDAKDCEIARLGQEKAKLARELDLARKVIELQKKASAMLDLLPSEEKR
jgi:transposase-like protein